MDRLVIVTGSKESGKTKKCAKLCSILSNLNKINDAFLFTSQGHRGFEYSKQLYNVHTKSKFTAKEIGAFFKSRLNETFSSEPEPTLVILDDVFGNFGFEDRVWSSIIDSLDKTKVILVIVCNDLNSMPSLFRQRCDWHINCTSNQKPISGTNVVRCNNSTGTYRKTSTPDVYTSFG